MLLVTESLFKQTCKSGKYCLYIFSSFLSAKYSFHSGPSRQSRISFKLVSIAVWQRSYILPGTFDCSDHYESALSLLYRPYEGEYG